MNKARPKIAEFIISNVAPDHFQYRSSAAFPAFPMKCTTQSPPYYAMIVF